MTTLADLRAAVAANLNYDPANDSYTDDLDGLINNFEYQAVLRDQSLASYLDQKGVTHLVVRDRGAATNRDGEFELLLPARLYPGTGDSLVVAMSDRLYSAPNGTAAVFVRRPAGGQTRR